MKINRKRLTNIQLSKLQQYTNICQIKRLAYERKMFAVKLVLILGTISAIMCGFITYLLTSIN